MSKKITKEVNIRLPWSLCFLTGIIFIVLKLVGIDGFDDASWWIILLPFYLNFAIFMAMMLVFCVFGLVAMLFTFILLLITGDI